MLVGIDLRCLQEPRGSGVARYAEMTLQLLLPALEQRGHRYQFFQSGRTTQRRQDEHTLVSRIPNTLLNASMGLLGIPRGEALFPNADVVWQPNPLFIGSLTQPHFVTIHDLSFVHMPDAFRWRTRLWYLRWVLSWLKAAPPNARLIAVSEHTAADILECFPRWHGRVAVVPPPPPVEDLSPQSQGQPYLLVLGTVEPRKNIAALLDAFNRFHAVHPEFRLVLCGQAGYGSEKLRRSRAVPAVEWAGYVSEEKRRHLMAGAFALIYPSFYEGYGYPPLEAFSAGVPVVASTASALTETLKDAACYVRPFHLADELPIVLHELVTRPEFRQRMQEKGRARLSELRRSYDIASLIHLWEESISA